MFVAPEMRTRLAETVSLSTVLPLIARIFLQGSRDQAAERSSGQNPPEEAGIKASEVLFQATNLGASTHLCLAGTAAVKTVQQHQPDSHTVLKRLSSAAAIFWRWSVLSV